MASSGTDVPSWSHLTESPHSRAGEAPTALRWKTAEFMYFCLVWAEFLDMHSVNQNGFNPIKNGRDRKRGIPTLASREEPTTLKVEGLSPPQCAEIFCQRRLPIHAVCLLALLACV